MDKRIIYTLSCPFTNEVHYVGKSTKGMTRPLSHLHKSHSYKIREWVKDVKDLGYDIKVRIIEAVPNHVDIDKRELYWIQHYIDKGNLLLNSNLIMPITISPGLHKLIGVGDGVNIRKISEFVKRRRRAIGMTQTEFAERSGLALTVIRKIEQGKTNINFNGLLMVLKMLGCTIDVVKIEK